MSVLLEIGNCIFISHEQYINNIYARLTEDKKGYRLKKELFGINCPFKKVNLKRRNCGSSKCYDQLTNDINYIKKEYTTIVGDLKINGIISSNNGQFLTNADAIRFSDECCSKSGTQLATNLNGKNEQCLMTSVNSVNYLFPSNCEFYSKDVSQIGLILSGCKYDLIVIDPPWWNKAVRRKKLKDNNGYQMMSNDYLKEIPIQSLLSNNGILVVWATNSQNHIQTLIRDIFVVWGVKMVSKWFWLKVTKSGEPIINFSEPPAKLPFEQIIIATRYDNELLKKSDGKIIVSVPSAIHSNKPPLNELIEKYMMDKDGKKLEIFARYLLPGWTSYGWEVLRLQHECLYEQHK